MPKGPVITPEIETLITSVYRKHPEWKAPRIRNEVESILFEKKLGFPRGWPGLSAVQKVLATVRKNIEKPSPEDKPWSMGTLGDFPIPPQAMSAVLNVFKLRLARGEPFSIRDAKWVSRFSSAIVPIWKHTAMSGGCIEDVKMLSWFARLYAGTEADAEIAGYSTFDSRFFDCCFMGIPVRFAHKVQDGKPLTAVIYPGNDPAPIDKALGDLGFEQLSPQTLESHGFPPERLMKQWEDYEREARNESND